MKAEFQRIFKLFEELEEAGGCATLTITSRKGTSSIKLVLECPTPSSPTTGMTTTTLPLASGRRSAAARARRRQARAGSPPPNEQGGEGESSQLPRQPLMHHLPASVGRQALLHVPRLAILSFASLNMDGSPPSLPPRPPPPPPPSPARRGWGQRDTDRNVSDLCGLASLPVPLTS